MCLQACRDAPRNERISRKTADVLARDTFRTAACRDESEDLRHIIFWRDDKLPSCPTPIYDEIITSHIRRSIRSQKQQSTVHFIFLCHAPKYGLCRIILDEIILLIIEHATWRKRVDPELNPGVI